MHHGLRKQLAALACAAFAFTLLSGGAAPLLAQDRAAPALAQKQPLPIADYPRWRSLQNETLSDDGQWVAWVYSQLRQDDLLHVRHVDSDREHVIRRGSRPVFSDDGRWVAYAVAPRRRGDEEESSDRGAELLELETGEKVGWENVAGFRFAPGSSQLLLQKPRVDSRARHQGRDVIVRDLRAGTDQLLPWVLDYEFNEPGSLLACTVDAPDQDGNGLYLLDLRGGRRLVLENARARYSRLTWSDDGTALAVLRGNDADRFEERENTLVAFTGVAPGSSPAVVAIEPGHAGLPENHVISEKGSLSWNEDATRLSFASKEQQRTPERPSGWQRASDVDVFHWNDDRIQSVQRAQASADRNRTDRAALHLATRRVVPLTDETLRSIQLTADGRWGIASDNRAYVHDWHEPAADYYRVDVDTGERRPVLEAHRRTLGLSPDSRWFLYWLDGHVWAYEIAAERHLNLTERAPVSFVNEEYDRIGEKPPHGVTGWTSDGRQVILESRYDLWLVPLDGSTPRNLTGGLGAEREIRFRLIRTDREERAIDLGRPLLLSAFGQWTKKAGFYEWRNGRMRELVYEDRHFGPPEKAARAERYLLTRETWTEFPDLCVTGPDFADLKRLTDANPQQAEYNWGTRILFDYTNDDGVRLQGTLAIPDDYQPGQRRPMLVNFYEKNSHNLHRYPRPTYASRPQFAGYVSNGYLVMQPDVHFRGGSSHSDMLECVGAAVRKVVEMGYADPARVGLHGHSYSGGGASYIATRTDMFAAIVAGAAPINLVSEFNQLFRGSGQNNHRYDIHGQGRYGTNPYDDFELYWNQSPISGVRTMNTPLIYMHGDNDQTVEYLQGMEFYNALRFNGKPVIFLSYPGEGHSLRRLENQLDFLTRMEQFYGHYLKGEPAPRWLTHGEPFLEKRNREPIPINTGG